MPDSFALRACQGFAQLGMFCIELTVKVALTLRCLSGARGVQICSELSNTLYTYHCISRFLCSSHLEMVASGTTTRILRLKFVYRTMEKTRPNFSPRSLPPALCTHETPILICNRLLTHRYLQCYRSRWYHFGPRSRCRFFRWRIQQPRRCLY